MRSLSRSTAAGAVALLLASAGSSLQAQARVPGWMYTQNTTVDSGGANKKSSMAVRFQVTDKQLRTDFIQLSGSAAELASIEGMYTVYSVADSTLTTVMPQQHAAMIINIADAVKMSGKPSFEHHLTRSDVEELGEGEKILGHATRKFRVTTAGTLTITMLGQSCTRPLDNVTEMWIAADVSLSAAMTTALKHQASAAGMSDVADQLAKAKLPEGTPLRTVLKETRLDERGNPTTLTSTMEFVEMSQAPIDPAVFTVPTGFTTMDMRPMVAQMEAAMKDPSMAAQAAEMVKGMCGQPRPSK